MNSSTEYEHWQECLDDLKKWVGKTQHCVGIEVECGLGALQLTCTDHMVWLTPITDQPLLSKVRRLLSGSVRGMNVSALEQYDSILRLKKTKSSLEEQMLIYLDIYKQLFAWVPKMQGLVDPVMSKKERLTLMIRTDSDTQQWLEQLCAHQLGQALRSRLEQEHLEGQTPVSRHYGRKKCWNL